jgi:YHS domain-containing protein
MKKLFAILAVAWSLSTLAAMPPAEAANPKCPICKMTLATKKDKTHSAPVKVNGKTYYCCSACANQKVKTASASYCAKCATTKLSAKKDAKHPYAVKVSGKTMYSCCPPAKAKATKTAAVPKCPKCNMTMSTTKSLMKNHAMKVNGKTYYCCTVCPKH